MSNKLKPIIEKYEVFLLIFLGIQPIIDVLTTLSLSLDITVTFGIIIRFLILLTSCLYILVKSIQSGKIYYTYYLFLLLLIIFIGIINNFYSKPIFSFVEEGKFIFKVVYLFIMLITYFLAFNSLKTRLKLEDKLLKNILTASLIINFIMIVSIATSTSLTSYDYSKIGYTGWFYAGNEIGAIIATIFPLVLLYTIKQTKTLKDLIKWIPTILMIFSLLAVGTKVGYGACILVLVVAFFMKLIELFQTRKTNIFKLNILKSSLLGILILLLIIITPFAPIYYNTLSHMNLLGIELPSDNTQVDESDQPKSNTKEQTNTKPQEPISNEQVENLLLSSRELFLENQKNEFINAPFSQKMFGMGYAGNYTTEPKMVEMDFYDLFFSFGIIGFLVLMAPIVYFVIRIMNFVLSNLKEVFNFKYSMYASSLLLAFGIAFMAGHVMTAPAVSIYIAAILSFLVVNFKIDNKF